MLLAGRAAATHVRAGEIIARPDSTDPLAWNFTIFIYRDTGGINAKDLQFYPGDITSPIEFDEDDVVVQPLPDVPGTEVWIYEYRHVYSAQGQYVARAVVENRNERVLNISNGNSSIFSFYVETEINTDRLNVGINSSPILTNPPVEQACVGQVYKHNPGAFDPDGDSLSYRLIVPRYADPNASQGQPAFPDVPLYQSPETIARGGQTPACIRNGLEQGAATFTLYNEAIPADSIAAGDLVWCAPAVPGQYNVAFEIREWRRPPGGGDPVELGYVVRDMQIIVEDCNNDPPVITTTLDTCVIAGDTLATLVTITDPDQDNVNVRVEGGPVELFPDRTDFLPLNRPSFLNQPTVPDPVLGQFVWRTECADVRRQPYEVLFSATDVRPEDEVRLSDLKTLRIRVVGPPPEGLLASVGAGSITLDWATYECTNAVQMAVYRREGTFDFERFPCEEGVPAGSGYEEIGRVPIGRTTFIDDSNLELGVNYCYRLVAIYPEPGGGLSLASEEACASLLLDGPVPLNVSVLETDEADGSIEVIWNQPLELDSALFGPPYRYDLGRRPDGGGAFETVFTTNDLLDTTFTDRGLNTQATGYEYQLRFYTDGRDEAKDSVNAGSVRLEAFPEAEAISLRWRATVPWNNGSRVHYIYRALGEDATPTLYDSVLVDGGDVYGYTDVGSNGVALDPCQPYSYVVVTNGTYDNPEIRSPLLNASQRVVTSPLDTLPPLPPTLTLLEDCDCIAVRDEQPPTPLNVLTWTLPPPDPSSCDTLPVSFNVYYAAREGDSLQLIAQVDVPTYQDLRRAGCYEVRTVDASGNESTPSNRICVDACAEYSLPNVFSPNGDDRNDLFVPQCYTPWSIRSVRFRVYNRRGQEVFAIDTDPAIRWNGTTDGRSLPVGTYYYVADVEFIRLRPEDERRTFKSWVQIMR
ncbi:MAG: gliding motility-associated C-terminal domain-containing protein [Catalinimonas sp.]